MVVGRPMPPLVLTGDEVQQLQRIANSRSLPHSIVHRAQIALAYEASQINTTIAKRMGLTGPKISPIVEGDNMDAQLLGNPGHALQMRRAHPSPDISLDGLAVTTH